VTESVSEEQVPAMEQESAGTKLARAREAQDLSVADVARALRLGIKQVEALEANAYDKLPGRTFVRGFVRNYARLVSLDPDRLVAEYFPALQAETHYIQVPSQHISFSEHHSKPWLKWLATGFVVVALVSWGILVWLGPQSAKPVVTSKPAASTLPALSAEMPDPAVAIASEAAAQPGEIAQARVLLSFSGTAWVEVRDKSGKKLYSQNNLAGTQQTVEGEPPLSLVIGSVPNVKLTYKGQAVDLAAHTKADVARLTLE